MRGALAWVGAALFVAEGAACTSAFGQESAKDTQVIARAMTFLDPAPTGMADLGIVYDTADADSLAQARRLADLFGAGVTVGRLTLRPRLVPLGALPGMQGVAGLFVTGRLGTRDPAIGAAARRLHIPTISTDLDCVRQAGCAVGFDSSRTVRILLSHAACQAAGIGFIQAFRILVTEL